MAMAELGLASDLLGGYLESVSTRRQLSKMMDFYSKLYGPLLGVAQYELGRLGKPSKELRVANQMALQGIGRTGQSAARSSAAYWGGQGNIGQARGEETRLRLATQEAKNRQNLDYAMKQETYKNAPLDRIAGIYGALSPLGSGMATGFLGKAQNAGNLFSAIGSAVGKYAGKKTPVEPTLGTEMATELPPLSEEELARKRRLMQRLWWQ